MKFTFAFFAFSEACNDLLPSEQCDNACIADFLSCQSACTTDDCNLQCDSQYKACFNNCPCGRSCPKGCEDCPSEYCYDPAKQTVVLGQRYDQTELTASYLVGENSISQVDAFSPGKNTIYSTGGVYFKGEFWVFGGYPDGNKISILRGCNFEEQTSRLVNYFSSELHSATVFNEEVWLCFGDGFTCEVFDGESNGLDDVKVSFERSYGASITVYDNQLIAVGASNDGGRGKVELRGDQWREIDDHPIDIGYTSVISFKTGILTVGGTTNRVDDNNEDGYDTVKGIYSLIDFTWSHVGNLQHGNMLGKAALNGNELLFVPGLKEPWVAQKLIWNGESFDYKESYETGMEGYVTFPLLFDATMTSCSLN
ncbi:Oidioi.mRNA.OKI2018_I69.chr2.g4822.t1.cds [Oikopleura dioica]|uniref:Oidioi.mRNA.OKI2018_I69.chr2.g4822.t1.cds n=1 Tax=Oikopleura dioica TaxID=34765 RepID=A0ABN7SYY3_OIKDI|nr:Oidioi.mRNA.OKI2018_I69.chr2.g4822.t1.cds [Oikopleura dioica]